MKEQSQDTIIYLKPEQLLADRNSRYGLKKTRIETLSANIMEAGEVQTPLHVVPLDEPDPAAPKATHRIIAGHYRHAAVTELNKEGAGLLLPCMVVEPGDAVATLKRQLAENIERESLSPMDTAESIKQLEDAGVPRMEVRKIFAAPGGRKGNVVQPASNSFINMHLSFLEFPKSVQEKIHDGRVGVAAAYQLTRVAFEKRPQVLADAEAERLKKVEQEEKDEEKFLKAQKDAEESRAKEAALAIELKKAQDAAVEAKKAVDAKAVVVGAAFQKTKTIKDAEAKKLAEEEFKAVDAEFNEAAKAAKAADKAAEKLADQVKARAEKALEAAKRLKEARSNAAKKTTQGKNTVGPGDIQKAASKIEGATPIPLNASQMREVIANLAAASAYPKVTAIGGLLKQVFAGTLDERKLLVACAKVTGEKKAVGKEAEAA